MTLDSASTPEECVRKEAIAEWFVRFGLADDPPRPHDLEAFELWKADCPENGRMFDTVKDEMRAYDNPMFGFLVKDRVNAALAAKSDARD